MMRLADPWLLLLVLLPLLAAVWLWRRHESLRPRLRFSSLALLGRTARTLRTRLTGLPLALLLLACALVVLALARPQSAWREHKRFTEGIDIMLVIDVSDSMHALDFDPNRLEKAKVVVKDFIKGRTDDQIGIVIFARDTFTLCPLTQDYQALTQFIDRIDFDLLEGNGTAIGMGLANAVNRLKDSKAKSKVVILLTDGENNAGKIDPLSAAEVAKQFGVRLYTIGVGTASGYVDIPVQTPFGTSRQKMPAQLDVAQLTQMAQMTGGQFFHAKDGKSLETIYGQIDKMERIKLEANETHYFDELAQYLMWPALLLILLAFTLETTWLRTYP
jgi:Ca-activated chloride channel family protein